MYWAASGFSLVTLSINLFVRFRSNQRNCSPHSSRARSSRMKSRLTCAAVICMAASWPGIAARVRRVFRKPAATSGLPRLKLASAAIRYISASLIAAEANFNLGKPDVAAGFLNTLRTRAAIPGHEAAMQITAAQVNLDFILDERARELCGEQLRWFDLKRTNKLIDRVTRLNPDAAQYIKAYQTVRPIPQSQIDAVTNKGEFSQNQGYQ